MTYASRYKSAQQRSGVFISYARSDGEAFAHRLRQQLEKQNIRLWQDRVGMEGGRDWWLQIAEALDNVAFMTLVMTPNALKSDVVRKEWRYARQQGVCVYPIKGAPNLDFESLPRWMRDQHFYDIGSLEGDSFGPEWQKFLNDLNKTPDIRRVPFMVEDLDGFIPRPEEFDQLIALLLDQSREEPVAITAALRGAGGYGKTTIAKALCHDERIQDAFDDGVLWVTLGENPGDMTGRVEDLIQTLSGERPGFSNTEAAIARLKELLADRDILIVIDDVWNRDHLRPFMQGGPRCARLITTRNLDTLPANAQAVKVDAMRPAEAVEMLRVGLPTAEIQRLDRDGTDEALRRLAARLGEWPLLLGLVNGALQDRVNNANQPLPDAIAYVNQALDKRGLTFFNARDTESRNQAVDKTLGVSLELLKPAERARYAELAIFPEDANIPLATLEKFWGKTGEADGFDAEFDTEALCARLNQFSLLHSFDLGARTIRLHDVIRTFLRDERKTDLPALNNQLLDAHRPNAGWTEAPNDDRYFWDHLADHLIEAGRGEELVATVKDWRYLAKKIFLRKAHTVENDLLKAESAADGAGSISCGWFGDRSLLCK
jgi:TIR domain-containing protein/NB-ARC domain-containing protein